MNTKSTTDPKHGLDQVSSSRPHSTRLSSHLKLQAPTWLSSRTLPATHYCRPSVKIGDTAFPVTAALCKTAKQSLTLPEESPILREVTRVDMKSSASDLLELLTFMVLAGSSILSICLNATSTAGWVRSLP